MAASFIEGNDCAMRKIILYGAGYYGKKAFDVLGSEKIEFFCDSIKIGTYCGVPIISLSKLREIHSGYDVIVAVADSQAREEIGGLLDRNGIPFSFWGGWHGRACSHQRELS